MVEVKYNCFQFNPLKKYIAYKWIFYFGEFMVAVFRFAASTATASCTLCFAITLM